MRRVLMKSERTLQCRRRKRFFAFLHFICLFGPLCYYLPYGFVTGQPAEKIGLSFTLIATVLLILINIIIDQAHRGSIHKTIMWILIIGVMFTLEEIKPFIFIMATVSILDELVIVKILDYYKAALISNKEIDKRERV